MFLFGGAFLRPTKPDRIEANRENEIAARQLSVASHVVCIIHATNGMEHHIRMTGVSIQDQIVFTAAGADIRQILVAAQEATLTIAVESGLHSMRFPSSIRFSVPHHASICVTSLFSPFHYFVAVTDQGACIRCNVPTFIFNLVAGQTGLSF